MKIRHRFLLSFTAIFIIVVILVGLILWANQKSNSYRTRIEFAYSQYAQVKKIESAIDRYLKEITNFLLLGRNSVNQLSEQQDTILKYFDEWDQMTRREIDFVSADQKSEEARELALQIALRQQFLNMVAATEKVIELIRMNRAEEAFNEFNENIKRDFEDKFTNAFAEIIADEKGEIENETNNAGKISRLIQRASILAIFLTLILVGFIFLILARGLVNPIYQLKNSMLEIGRGNWDTEISVSSKDVIGEFADSFKKMVNELKTSRRDLVAAKEFNENIIQSMSDALIFADSKGIIQKVNPSVINLLSYDETELLNHPIDMLFNDDGIRINKILNKGSVSNIQKVFISKDGREIPILFSGVAIHDDVLNISGVVCIAKDITDIRKAEEKIHKLNEGLEKRVVERTIQLEYSNKRLEEAIVRANNIADQARAADRAKSEFLAGMSHELRTPLNHIIGFTQLIADKEFGDLNKKQEEYLLDVLQSSNHLLAIINEVLDLSKVEAGKMELEPTGVDIEALLNNSLTIIKERALRHGLTVSTDIQTVPDTIIADERKIKQVIYNLLSNAVKFTPDGGDIKISAETIDYSMIPEDIAEDGVSGHAPMTEAKAELLTQKFVRVSVRDTGVGLAQKDIQRLFKPFEQVGSVPKRSLEGTGLGLHLTKNFIDLHKGHVWAESEGKNKGTTIYFTIPVRYEMSESDLDAEFETDEAEHMIPQSADVPH